MLSQEGPGRAVPEGSVPHKTSLRILEVANWSKKSSLSQVSVHVDIYTLKLFYSLDITNNHVSKAKFWAG